MSALDRQIGGNHYKEQKMQPMELAYKCMGTPAFCKVAKYCTRNKGDKIENLEKALHCIEIEQELLKWDSDNPNWYYIRDDNGIPGLIREFTDEHWLRNVLHSMYDESYGVAVKIMKAKIKEEKNAMSGDDRE